jgi:hypothetical protein
VADEEETKEFVKHRQRRRRKNKFEPIGRSEQRGEVLVGVGNNIGRRHDANPLSLQQVINTKHSNTKDGQGSRT